MRKAALVAAFGLMAGTGPAAADFASCVQNLVEVAVNSGVERSTASRALAGAQFNERILRFSRSQPEFRTPIWDYFAFLIDEERVRDGARMMRRHAQTLAAVEAQYGVDRYVIAALWGIESNYGKDAGDDYLPHSLANLICGGAGNTDFWRGELIAALKLVDRGDVELDELFGSWAGAFGQTQFIPTTYQRLAVDFDGDGRRDLVRSVPDALGSAANYLRNSGWDSGGSWMIEVKAPDDYSGPDGRGNRASLSRWAERGVTRADGSPLGGEAQAGLLLPAGPRGPGFLVFSNFDAIYSYNNAESYALAISHLADRLAGYPPLRTPWPTDDPGLSRAERLRLQELLLAAGYDIGEADGKIGPITQAAIQEAERRFGMEPTGRAGRAIYEALGGR